MGRWTVGVFALVGAVFQLILSTCGWGERKEEKWGEEVGGLEEGGRESEKR